MTPDGNTIEELLLDVGDGHALYVQDWGNKGSMPVIYLHGGPGNGVNDNDKKKFDPESQRVIFFDQRGSGKSTAPNPLADNTTDKLVGDINTIAERLSLEKFILAGGSWGTTLALAYAIEHPENVAGMVLDGIFTGRKQEVEWTEKGGWRQFFPDVWKEYAAGVTEQYRDNPSAYHYEKAVHGTPEEKKRAAFEYLKMELSILKLDDRYEAGNYETFDPTGGLIELHYLANGFFLPEGHILKHAAKLTMPVYLIQGRYDMVCPPSAAYELHEALPNSRLIWTINGHTKQHEAKNFQRLLLEQLTGAHL